MSLNHRKTSSHDSVHHKGIFNKRVRVKGEISGDMSPEEVAEIVSEKMMEEVRKQFLSGNEKDGKK